MRAEVRWGLVGWICVALLASAAAGQFFGLPAVELGFLLVPAGFALGLVLTAVVHYLGPFAGSSAPDA